ncbi:hypothetical protein C5609_14935 [Pseudomonas putida]|uniref:hypothetical protein n=1 Tax=Pseudomonas putida TaxID=303 RepID=UPI0010701B80|nr:hypothetical protein [Pseudomonas putida]TFF51181.1 hypothetical protein C5609_14935 [Pseudomonas putida]
MNAIHEYRAALLRLIENRPSILPKGSSINNDTVALEAGRKRGSIKKSRAEHAQLILDIKAAAIKPQETKNDSNLQKIEKQKTLKKSAIVQRDSFREKYEKALAKIASLEYENFYLKKQLAEIIETGSTNNNVIDLIKTK